MPRKAQGGPSLAHEGLIQAQGGQNQTHRGPSQPLGGLGQALEVGLHRYLQSMPALRLKIIEFLKSYRCLGAQNAHHRKALIKTEPAVKTRSF